jgi:hypothetical protein
LVVLEHWKNFDVGNRIHIADDQKLFLMFDQLGDVFTEERERRVRDHDVCLL